MQVGRRGPLTLVLSMWKVLSFPDTSQGPASSRPSFSQVTVGTGTPVTTHASSSGVPTAMDISVGWDAASTQGGSARCTVRRVGSSPHCSPKIG